MKNDYITVFDLKAGLPKAQLAPFNTTPLHGIALSGLESLAHDLGYSVLSPFGFPRRGKNKYRSVKEAKGIGPSLKVKNKYRSVKEAKGIGKQSSSSMPMVPQSSAVAVEDEGVIYDSTPNYTVYVIAGFLTIGALGFGMYSLQNRKKRHVREGRLLQAFAERDAFIQNPLLTKLRG